MADILYFVVPCYNEEEVLPETADRLLKKLSSLKEQGIIDGRSRIMFVDDGSKDRTWEIISSLHGKDIHFSGVKESRNRGHQNALLAGLFTAVKYADVTITLDADLQDDIEAVDGMLAAYAKGADVVYGVRSSRKKDTFFKKFTAESYYKVMKRMGVDIVFNHADYRLMSKRAVEGLQQFGEVNLFLRGIVPMVGYPSDKVYYERSERFAGESKYPLKKMVSFALDGITSFSVKPLGMIFSAGCAITCLGFLALIVTIILLALSIIPAWGLILAALALCTGIVVTCIGLVGIYVGKAYAETKARPRFIIEKILNDEDGQ